MSLEALIFDVDGTLAETEDVHLEAFNQAFRDAGLEDWQWSAELYGQLLAVSGGKERIRHYLETCRPDFELPADITERIARLHQAKTRYYTEWVENGKVEMRPGVRRLMEEARAAGLRLAIATTTTPANVTALIEHNLAEGSTGWFEVIAAGSDVPNKKPAPDIYEYALQKMNLDPGACIAFEDTENGLRSAAGAGIPTVLTVSHFSDGQNFDGALIELDHLGEPDRPMIVRKGTHDHPGYVDVDLLRRLHAAVA